MNIIDIHYGLYYGNGERYISGLLCAADMQIFLDTIDPYEHLDIYTEVENPNLSAAPIITLQDAMKEWREDEEAIAALTY